MYYNHFVRYPKPCRGVAPLQGYKNVNKEKHEHTPQNPSFGSVDFVERAVDRTDSLRSEERAHCP